MDLAPYSFSSLYSKFNKCPLSFYIYKGHSEVIDSNSESDEFKIAHRFTEKGIGNKELGLWKVSVNRADTGERPFFKHIFADNDVTLTQIPKGKWIVKVAMNTESGSLALIGSAVHDALDDYVKYCLDEKVTSDIVKAKQFALTKAIDFKANEEERMEIAMLVDKFAENNVVPVNSDVRTEIKIAIDRELKIVPYYSPNAFFRGRLDYHEITGEILLITDYKTGYSTDYDLIQPKIYAWLASILHPEVNEFKVKNYFVRFNLPKSNIVYRNQLDGIKEAVSEMVKRVEATETFEPTPGQACDWCEVSQLCTHKASPLISCSSQDEADTLAQDMMLAEKQLKDVKAALKKHCSKHGNFVVNGMEIGWQKSESKGVSDLGEFARLVKECGKTPAHYLAVNGTKLKKLLQDEDVAIALKPILEDKSSLSFKAKKAKKK